MEYQNNEDNRRDRRRAEMEEYDRRQEGDPGVRRNPRVDMKHDTMGMSGHYDRGMGKGRKRDSREQERQAEEAYGLLDEQMCKALDFHSQLADYFCFLGLQGFKRMAEFQFMKECAEMRKMHRRYIDHHGKILPVKDVRKSSFIPQSWSQYTTKDIDDSMLSKFTKLALESWHEWEKEGKEIYEDICDMLMDAGLHSDSEYVKDLLEGAEKECKKVMRLIEKLNGTGYDVTSVHGMQDKYHEKYKKKYEDRFTTKNNYPQYRDWDEEEDRRGGRRRRYQIGY